MKTRRTFFGKALSVGLCLVLGTGMMNAKVIYLDANVSAEGDGTTWENAFKTWEAAMDAATSGDDIHVAQGEYISSGVKVLPWTDGVDVYGGYNAQTGERDIKEYESVLKANGASRVLYAANFTQRSYVDGFTFTGGGAGNSSTTNGRMVYMRNGQTLSNCLITGNSKPTSVIALAGGGDNFTGTLMPTIENCVIDNNVTKTSAISIVYAGSVINCLITNNTSDGNGAGVNIQGKNYALLNAPGKPTTIDGFESRVINTVFANNTAKGNGGGAYSKSSEFINCTFVNNNANLGGGALLDAIYDKNENEEEGTIQPTIMKNCVFWGNEATKADVMPAQIQVCIMSTTRPCSIYNSAIQDMTESALGEKINLTECVDLSSDNAVGPKFINPAATAGVVEGAYDADWSISTGSVLIDAGKNEFNTTETDLAGNPRIYRDVIDLGAYENQTVDTTTAIVGNKLGEVKFISYNGMLEIVGASTQDVFIYNSHGQIVTTVYNAQSHEQVALTAGVYVVRIAGVSSKVVL